MAACSFNSTAKEKKSAGELEKENDGAKKAAENRMRAAGGSEPVAPKETQILKNNTRRRMAAPQETQA
jgi:hypothetical protein